MRLRGNHTAPIGLPGRELRRGESGEFPDELANNPGVCAFLSVGWLIDESAIERAAKAAEAATASVLDQSAPAPAEAAQPAAAPAPASKPAQAKSGRGGK